MGRKHKSTRLKSWFNNTAKKSSALGMCIHKARRMLVNQIIFSYFMDEHGEVFCFRCGEELAGEFHIDHKKPWMFSGDEVNLYFNLDNIALSHPTCNSLIRRNFSKLSAAERAERRVMLGRLSDKRHRHKKKLLQKLKSNENT